MNHLLAYLAAAISINLASPTPTSAVAYYDRPFYGSFETVDEDVADILYFDRLIEWTHSHNHSPDPVKVCVPVNYYNVKGFTAYSIRNDTWV